MLIFSVPLLRKLIGVPQAPGGPGFDVVPVGGHGSPGKLEQQPSPLRILSY